MHYQLNARNVTISLHATAAVRRIVFTTANGEPGLNYLCKGYKHFSVARGTLYGLRKGNAELMAKRPPSNVMEWAKTRQNDLNSIKKRRDCKQKRTKRLRLINGKHLYRI